MEVILKVNLKSDGRFSKTAHTKQQARPGYICANRAGWDLKYKKR